MEQKATVGEIQQVALHFMLLALHPSKFIDNLCKKPLGSMDELCEWTKGYIQMEEMSRFHNEVCQDKQKGDKRESHTKPDSHKSNKRHKPDKH